MELIVHCFVNTSLPVVLDLFRWVLSTIFNTISLITTLLLFSHKRQNLPNDFRFTFLHQSTAFISLHSQVSLMSYRPVILEFITLKLCNEEHEPWTSAFCLLSKDPNIFSSIVTNIIPQKYYLNISSLTNKYTFINLKNTLKFTLKYT